MTVLLCAGIMLILFGIFGYVTWMTEFGTPYEKATDHLCWGAMLIFIWCALREVHSEIKKDLTTPKRGD